MAVSNARREGNRRRQAAFRTRQKARIAELEAELEKASATPAEKTAEVLQALDRIRRMLEAQSVWLVRLSRVEHGAPILRQLTEIRRHLGITELHRPEGATRRRPMGVP